ncbi:MAG: hypothetical protein ACKPKO_65035, partial [Candidatus Fonsibacter sp.]
DADLVVLGLDLGGSEAQALCTALEMTGKSLTMMVMAVQRLGNGETLHAASVIALGIRQWGTRFVQCCDELTVLGPPVVIETEGGTASYRMLAASRTSRQERRRAMDPPPILVHRVAVANRMVRILA